MVATIPTSRIRGTPATTTADTMLALGADPRPPKKGSPRVTLREYLESRRHFIIHTESALLCNFLLGIPGPLDETQSSSFSSHSFLTLGDKLSPSCSRLQPFHPPILSPFPASFCPFPLWHHVHFVFCRCSVQHGTSFRSFVFTSVRVVVLP